MGAQESRSLRRELLGLAVWGVAVLLLLSLLSFHPLDPKWGDASAGAGKIHNWVGPLGSSLAATGIKLLGMTVFALPVMGFLSGLALLVDRSRRVRFGEVIGFAGVGVSLSILVQLIFPAVLFRGAVVAGGGVLGRGLVALLTHQVSTGGAWVIGVTGLLVAARIGFGIQLLPMTRSLFGLAGRLMLPVMGLVGSILVGGRERLRSFHVGVVEGMRDSFEDWREERELAREERRWQREERLAELEERRLDEELGLTGESRHGRDLEVLGEAAELEVSDPDLEGPAFVAGAVEQDRADDSTLLGEAGATDHETGVSTASRVRRPTREQLGLDIDALLEPAAPTQDLVRGEEPPPDSLPGGEESETDDDVDLSLL
ncbi:MAG TPA: hypothetical protein DIU15_04420, partial [Deltaproteobacteria bacterium]|nr:hypothetical protein [Deltaproteobacteria bacterium]